MGRLDGAIWKEEDSRVGDGGKRHEDEGLEKRTMRGTRKVGRWMGGGEGGVRK